MGRIILLLTLLLLSSAVHSHTVRGVVTDDTTLEPMIGATVCLIDSTATATHSYCEATGVDGTFIIELPRTGRYRLRITSIGYKPYDSYCVIDTKRLQLGRFTIAEDLIALEGVDVTGRDIRATQRSDTMEYNANAFKVMEGSNVEALIAKMPGIVVENGSVQAQGETVRKVLVDGKEFFGDDAKMALQNLPADIIESIQVFDRRSDESQLSGIDDGNDQKTINVVTKQKISDGQFGKFYAGIGYGDNLKYHAGANYNYFAGSRRLSILGLSNNINKQNFSQEDIVGVTAASASTSRRRGSQGSSGSDFMVAAQQGVTLSNGVGVNYADRWLNKIDFTASYFFNHSDNITEEDKQRDYFNTQQGGSHRTSNANSRGNSINFNHRFSARLEYRIDKRNTLLFTPSLSLQDNRKNSYSETYNYYDQIASNSSNINNLTHATGLNFSSSLTYSHRFKMAGQQLSVSLSGRYNSKHSNNNNRSITHSGVSLMQVDSLFRKILYPNTGYQLRARATFSQPLSRGLQLQFNYNIDYSQSDADKRSYLYDWLEQQQALLDTTLSNTYISDYITQQAGVGLRYRYQKWYLSATLNYQYAQLLNEQEFPIITATHRSYHSLLPQLMARWSPNKSNGLRINYYSRSVSPTISQLQNVLNTGNMLFIRGGNPTLDQQIQHSTSIRYTLTHKTGSTLIVMVSAGVRQSYIGDSIVVATSDMEVKPGSGVILRAGGQYTEPVNLDGYYNLESMVTYGFPFDWIKSNVNISANFTYTQIPSVYNSQHLKTHNYGLIPKLSIGSNFSRRLDFTLSYAAGLHLAQSSGSGPTQNSNYLNHNAVFNIDWLFWKGFTVGSNLNYQGYQGFSQGQSLHYVFWNLSLGKKFMKSNRGEIKLEAYDLLRQQRSYQRNVGSNYYEDVTTNVMQPYFMLSFVYDLRLFN